MIASAVSLSIYKGTGGASLRAYRYMVEVGQDEVLMSISYELNEIAFSGTHLGRAYTFNGLQKHRGVEYDPKQDSDAKALLSVRVHMRLCSLRPRSRRYRNSFYSSTSYDQSELMEPIKPSSTDGDDNKTTVLQLYNYRTYSTRL